MNTILDYMSSKTSKRAFSDLDLSDATNWLDGLKLFVLRQQLPLASLWVAVVDAVVLRQPSSCFVERIFSQLDLIIKACGQRISQEPRLQD